MTESEPIEVRKWKGVFIWKYKNEDVNCAICRTSIMEGCPICSADSIEV
jgi:hypothetical protein